MDLPSLLKEKRSRAKSGAENLVWENIEKSLYWFAKPKLDGKALCEAKLETQYFNYHATLVSLHTAFSGTVVHLKASDVQNILQYGAARRISAIYRNANRVCEIAYLNREEPLSQDESGELGDSLMVTYVHIVGVIDALGITLKRLAGSKLEIAEKHSDMLSKKFRKSVSFEGLEQLFEQNDVWFRRIKEGLRNRFVHRVPPYVAPSAFSTPDADEYARLDQLFDFALRNEEWDKLDQIRDMQSKLGKFFPFISFIDTNEHMPLLPTFLDDILRFQVLLLTIFEEIVPRLDFQT